jgi:membrane-bound lytic murein transglycosylase MltF
MILAQPQWIAKRMKWWRSRNKVSGRWLYQRYFRRLWLWPISPSVLLTFAFASYNAGAARTAKLRVEAKDHGLDPDKWFNNVEMIASRRIGQETVAYVRNIFKYYTAYRLQLDAIEARNIARQKLAPKNGPS